MDIKVSANTVIVFDLDDTLYYEIDFLRSAYLEIAKTLDSENSSELFAFMFSAYRNKMNVFKLLSDKYNISMENLIHQYRSHVPSIKLSRNLKEIFFQIKSCNGKIGVITDGRSTTQRSKIKALNIEHIVDVIVISEEIESEKPNLINFKIVEDTFPNCNYYYIGDNLKKDFIAPNTLGWDTIGLVDRGLNIHNSPFEALNNINFPKNFILSFSEINVTK